MSKEFSAKELSDFLYYRKLPEVYRMADEESTEKKDLYRYISALIEGAFDDTLVKAAEMKNLVDPWKVNKDILPLLYKAWGIPYFEYIGEEYNRRFLANIGEFLRRRGTMGGVRYIIRTLSGMECSLRYHRERTAEKDGRYLDIEIHPRTLQDLLNIGVGLGAVNSFLSLHIPYYIQTAIHSKAEVSEKVKLVGISMGMVWNTSHTDLAYYENKLKGGEKFKVKSNLTKIAGFVNEGGREYRICDMQKRTNWGVIKLEQKKQGSIVGYSIFSLNKRV